MKAIPISVTLNGEAIDDAVEPRLSLADYLRHERGFYGTHVGCEQGVCGMCTVRFDGEPVKSCLLFAAQADGHTVDTVESLAHGDELHPLQEAFRDHHGIQCGFCTPAFLLVAVSLAERSHPINEGMLRDELAGVLCRCTGYESIMRAVMSYLGQGHGESIVD